MKTLDLRGLRCPLPVLKARKALREARVGDAIEVLSDDPLAAVDIPNLVREIGDELILAERQGGSMRFVARRSMRE